MAVFNVIFVQCDINYAVTYKIMLMTNGVEVIIVTHSLVCSMALYSSDYWLLQP